MASKTGKKLTAAQSAQLARAREKAKVAHPAGHQTAKQLVAERQNLVLARAAQAGSGRHQTAKQIIAERDNLAKARVVEHAKHGKGHQTAKQLAAERSNLAKARAKRKSKHHSKHHKGFGKRGGVRSLHRSTRPLGTHRISFNGSYKLTIRKPTGVVTKFKKRLAPTGFETRTGWHSSRAHHMTKRLHIRRKRVPTVKHWRRRRGRLTPR